MGSVICSVGASNCPSVAVSPVQAAHVEVRTAKDIYQEGERASGEPEVFVFPEVEGVEQAERIVDVRACLAEVVAVILPLQVRTGFLVCFAVGFRHPLHVGFQCVSSSSPVMPHNALKSSHMLIFCKLFSPLKMLN